MSCLGRRTVLATAGATVVGGLAGCTGAGSGDRLAWDHTLEASTFSTAASIERTEEGYLLAGTVHDDGAGSAGLIVDLAQDGAIRDRRRYVSSDQRGIRAQEPQVSPMPTDWLSFARPVEEGVVLVGWTYYDGPAVPVARIYWTDHDGTVRLEKSLETLEGASAMSYLTDAVTTDRGLLCCGIESPGILQGGAGWLVWLDATGSVRDHRRYPATDRDVTSTVQRDIFHSIESVNGGYVVCGSFEPDPESAPVAWILAIDDDGAVRWEDTVSRSPTGGTVAFETVRSEGAESDVLVVGAIGTDLTRHRWPNRRPVPDGDGFIAAYTSDGSRVWLEELEDTPLLCGGRGPTGPLSGGSRVRNQWVGTDDRTVFESTGQGTVVSVAPAHRDGIILAGRRLRDDSPQAWVGKIDAMP